MQKIEKFLSKLSPLQRQIAQDLVNKIIKQDLRGLDIKRLKGQHNIFRARKGNLRIIYCLEKGMATLILIGNRSEKIYKKY